MSPILIFVLIIFSLILLFQAWGYIKSKKSVGSDIQYSDIEEEFVEKLKDKKGLIYFYSPQCHNCNIQSPIIEKISNNYSNIISIDASSHLKTARIFNVLGTPSTIIFSGNKIKGYYVGVKSEDFLIDKLTNS
ncbi:MAG: thioredoxin family protein [Melioribacteraceae bacterium]|nr:thioredoxin family protein [Melioribacteraceae bacterium]